jgi:hypothetical protein
MFKLKSLNEFFSRNRLKIYPLSLCNCQIEKYSGKRPNRILVGKVLFFNQWNLPHETKIFCYNPEPWAYAGSRKGKYFLTNI